MKSLRSSVAAALAFAFFTTVLASCGELTGPESPSTPTGVTAVLLSASSAKVTWTPSPLNDGVISYSIFRNGTKVGESETTEFTDTGLAQQTTYVYSVAANCKGGTVSDRSAETTESTITTVDITPPHVNATSPVDGATGVSRAGTSTVTFSEPMDPATINTSTFNIRVTSSGQILAGTVTYNATTRVAEFVPASPLPNATQLTVTVTTGVKDLAGNAMATAFTARWTTRDEDGPTVTASIPAQGTTVVPANATMTVTFSENVQASTITAANISLKVTSSGATVAGTLSFNGTNTVTFTPSEPLVSGTNYTFTVANVRDLGGNNMPAPFVLTFTADSTPPTVTSVVPANLATNVATNTSIQVKFSEAMDASTITSANIVLKNTATSALITTTVVYDAATNTATIQPVALSNATNYTLTVTTGVKDVVGNALAAPFTSTFTTVPIPDTTRPTIVARSPAPNATNVATTTTVQVTFSEPIDQTTINSTNFKLALTATPGSPITTTFAYNSATNTVTMTPSAPLASDTLYTVTIGTGVKDLAGNSLLAQDSWSFKTIPDTTAPTINGTFPTNGATGVSVDSVIRVTFSEDMAPATLNGTTFTVKTTVGSIPVSGVVSYNVATRTATFTPNAKLAASTGYTVTVTSGAKDLAGNGLAGTFTFQFTTAPPAP